MGFALRVVMTIKVPHTFEARFACCHRRTAQSPFLQACVHGMRAHTLAGVLNYSVIVPMSDQCIQMRVCVWFQDLHGDMYVFRVSIAGGYVFYGIQNHA